MQTFHPDTQIVNKIKDFVDEGLVNVREIKILLEVYVKTQLLPSSLPTSMNRRFYPLSCDIKNIVAR
jgi:hypothetical protein